MRRAIVWSRLGGAPPRGDRLASHPGLGLQGGGAVQVSEETKHIYDMVVANTGSSDEEIEVHLRVALANVLEGKIEEMQELHERLVAEARDKASA